MILQNKRVWVLCIVSLIFCACKKDNANARKDKLLHYEFANNLNDSSGNNFNGFGDTAIDFVPDRFSRINHAIRFNGAINSSYFFIPPLGNKQVKDTFSINYWFTFNTNNRNHLFYKSDANNGTESGTTILINDSKLRIIFGEGVTLQTKEYDGIALLNTNSWYHLVVTVNGSNDVQVYLNGVWYNTQLVVTGNITNIDFKENPLYVTGLMGGSEPLPVCDGKIDDFRIYNYALSAAEVLELYNYHP